MYEYILFKNLQRQTMDPESNNSGCTSTLLELEKQGADSITYKELIELAYQSSQTTSTNVTDNCQKEAILDYICKKIGLNQEDIPLGDLNDLTKTIATFFSRFVKKY